MGAVNAIREWLRRLLAGKTERRLAMVILVTTMVPLAAALYLATSMFRQASAIWFNPEIGEQLDRGVDVYKDYVRAIKDDLKHQTVAIAADPVLREAAKKRNVETIESEIDALFPHFPELVSLAVEDAAGQVLSRRDRGRPVDTATERSLEVRRPLTDEADAPMLVASFAVSRKRLDELESAGVVVARYHQLEASRADLYQGYLRVFALLLGITAAMTTILGAALARGLTKRINRLGAAITVVAQGDLSVRVPVTGTDELTELARTFNRMIAEMAQSRARIEFLQRVGAWQDMAQRLAHEIKNPLTPIQLAVQECHKKYAGDDPRYRQLLDATLEIVEEEVGTLRRLVGNFSNFARLPHAELAPANLSDFLRDCEAHLGHLEDPSLGEGSSDERAHPRAERRDPLGGARAGDHGRRRSPDAPARPREPRPQCRAGDPRRAEAQVDARGRHRRRDQPGPRARRGQRRSARATARASWSRTTDRGSPTRCAAASSTRISRPRRTGPGLGLAIVKKVVVEHGGEIEATASRRLGGARFVLRLPGLKILSIAEAAKEARERAKKQGVETVDPPA